MGQEKKMLKMMHVELKKKVSVLCNFCECSRSRYEPRPHQAESSMESQVKRLRLLTKRLTGMDPDGLSFTELRLLESQLRDGLLIVRNQKTKVKLQEDERLTKQKKEAENGNVLRREFSVSCISSGSSSEERPQKQDDETPALLVQRAFERQNNESMQQEFERLWRLKERLNGRELDGMTFYQLLLLEVQILVAISRVMDQMFAPRKEEYALQRKEALISLLAEQETCSLENGNGHRDIPLRFGSQYTLLSVSRKLRRFRNRYHRKNMPEIRLVSQTPVASD